MQVVGQGEWGKTDCLFVLTAAEIASPPTPIHLACAVVLRPRASRPTTVASRNPN